MIMPANAANLAKAQHWLMSRDKEFKELSMPIDKTKSQPVLITEFDWVDSLLYRLSFPDKKERVSVYG